MAVACEATNFQHEPLPDISWIRLLRIQPARAYDSIISCVLEQFDESCCPDYVALSYEWGDPTPRQTILINGCTRMVHASLSKFLHWQRDNRPAEEYLWVDSLCLDQGNHNELNEQVKLMGRVYAWAKSVTIWLGDGPATAQALDGLAESRRRRPLEEFLFLRVLASNSYWTRVWIAQEIIHARKAVIACDGAYHQVDYDHLASTIMAPGQMQRVQDKPERCGSFLHYHSYRQFRALANGRAALAAGAALGFWHLLMQFADSKATLAIDSVYGLLGLASHLCPLLRIDLLDVNYDKTPEDVLWDTMFESGVPPTECNNFFLDLYRRLVSPKVADEQVLHEVPASLSRYVSRPTTSNRHRRQARTTLRVLQAFLVLKWHVGSEQWQRVRIPLWLSTYYQALSHCETQDSHGIQNFLSPTDFQHAMALGLCFTCLPTTSSSSGFELPRSSPWLCAHHRSAEDAEPNSTSRPWSPVTFPAAIYALCGAHSGSCDLSSHTLVMHEVGVAVKVPKGVFGEGVNSYPWSWEYIRLKSVTDWRSFRRKDCGETKCRPRERNSV